MLSRTIFAAAFLSAALPVQAAAPALDAKVIDDATFTPPPDTQHPQVEPEIVKAEVLLDRAHFSPGPIDGIVGDNLHDALTAYQRQMSLDPSGKLDQATWSKLTADTTSPLVGYEITAADSKGPFTKRIPINFEAQSRLKRLGYQTIVEELAERFHMSQPLLKALNPKSRFKQGDTITVANVDMPVPTEKAARVVVDKTGHNVEALAADGRLMAFYPASIGSSEKPAPSGDFTIHRVDRDPIYTYDPKYHFKGVSAKHAFSIAPGPNNPVGVVWMDLGGDGYGIHGTPNPTTVGKTQSHGCIRLANWNALNLAERVEPGTPVSFGDVPGSNGPVVVHPVAGPTVSPAAPGQPTEFERPDPKPVPTSTSAAPAATVAPAP